MEKAGLGLSDQRTLLVFQILDQIVPKLGVFAPVVRNIRNELLGEYRYLPLYLTNCNILSD